MSNFLTAWEQYPFHRLINQIYFFKQKFDVLNNILQDRIQRLSLYYCLLCADSIIV